ncbi:Tim44 domain-containing protein [Rhodovastum atsumiense]|nr:TIM44-like domain-containing protein [Rhodovastum atsumiense]CAH2600192.1 Tim44 domain-containing protein [Rhodovastum atsumiense]
MRRTSSLIAAAAALSLALAPGFAWAKAGGGGSMGSRGSRTYSAPPPTNTAPSTTMPMQRSMTPQAGPSAPSSLASSPAAAPMSGRSAFMSGLMGGLIGAGIGGLLFGGGLFGGINGIGSFFWFLVQIALVALLVRFLYRWFMRNRAQTAFAGPNLFARGNTDNASPGPRPMMGGSAGSAQAQRPVQITPADYQNFEHLLQTVQGAWSNHDLNALRAVSTPEMAGYFAEQIGEQARRGVRNTVSEVRLEQGDLSEAWSEGAREYATVAMRFSMIDVTRDGSGRVIEGDPARRTETTEIWTFLRAPGERWVLSAIQQTR